MRRILHSVHAGPIRRDQNGARAGFHDAIQLFHERDALGARQMFEEMRAMHFFDTRIVERPRRDYAEIVDYVRVAVGRDVDTKIPDACCHRYPKSVSFSLAIRITASAHDAARVDASDRSELTSSGSARRVFVQRLEHRLCRRYFTQSRKYPLDAIFVRVDDPVSHCIFDEHDVVA